MAETKDCPKCGLVNPLSAQRCDCGYDFATRSAQPPPMVYPVRRGPGVISQIAGVLCLALGGLWLLLSVTTFLGSGLPPEESAPYTAGYVLGRLIAVFCPGMFLFAVAYLLLRRRR